MYFTIWTEKIESKGEDAPPTLLIGEDDTAILAVYDGLGGSGSKLYQISTENEEVFEYSGAYLASRLAKSIVEDFYLSSDLENDFMQDLKNILQNDFQDYLQQIDNQPSKLKSKLIRALPTTLAGILLEENKVDNLVNAWAFWAGDSRCYILQADGLQQISRDDLTGSPDAMHNLWQDATISNCVNAELDFQLHLRTFSFDEPSILITATDGCFGYVPSPMHFEFLLLNTLAQSKNEITNWQMNLKNELQKIAGDDCSMSLWAWGFENFDDLKKAFISREKEVFETYIQPLQSIDNQTNRLKEELWETYKNDYYLKD